MGDIVPFAAYLEESRQLADGDAEVVAAPGDWLAEHGANYWAGPDSLPSGCRPDHDGFLTRSNDAAREAGLQIRPWMDTLRDTLADERGRGLGRERKAGLSPETERRLLARVPGRARLRLSRRGSGTPTLGSCSTGKLTLRAMKQTCSPRRAVPREDPGPPVPPRSPGA